MTLKMKPLITLCSALLVASALAQNPSVIGTWKLEKDSSTKLTLTKDGTFHFAAPSYKSTSSGTFEFRDGAIWLTYREVDGEALTVSSAMRVPVANDGSSFSINRFRYVRL